MSVGPKSIKEVSNVSATERKITNITTKSGIFTGYATDMNKTDK